MSHPIQVVFFDAAETLFHVNGSVAEIYFQHGGADTARPRPSSWIPQFRR